MAVNLDLETPVFGYFVTNEFFEIPIYLDLLLQRYGGSIVCLLHASAEFEKDGTTQEMHMPTNRPFILDPQMPTDFLHLILENQYCLAQETDHFENMDGSGWTFKPGTIRFWIKVYPCQPNDRANENKDNTSQYDDDNQDDQWRERKYNYLCYAILEFFARSVNLKVPRITMLKFEMLEKFNIENNIGFTYSDLDCVMLLQDLPQWHKEQNRFNIRVFSMLGNLLYATAKEPEYDMYIDLYLNSNNNFALVRNLWTLFKKKNDREFCMNCLKWTSDGHNCDQVKTSPKSDEIILPNVPLGRHGLVGYADFESITGKNGFHLVSGWGAVFIDKMHMVYDNNLMNRQESDSLILDFINYVCSVAIKFGEDTGHETDQCPLCDEDVSGDVIIGRNFINGRQGTHHEKCWELNKNSMYVFFHNFRGYDSHFLIKQIVATCTVLGLSATSAEKFNLISISCPTNPLIRITFKDTFNFFSCSLAKCVSMVENWVYTPEEVRGKKGLFPYDWFDDFEKLNATELPAGPWFNKLTNETVDPAPAFEEWTSNGFNTFAQYHDYYMMSDVLQLADCFEEFRRTCVDEFDIDAAHFQGAPSFTWYLGVKHNHDMFKVILEPTVYLDIQNNIRGGISQAMTRYINIENKPDESILFLDVNSLYSKCMTYKMPGLYLKTVDELPDGWEDFYTPDGDYTAFVCVDLVYPAHLHDRDWPYPLAPHKFNNRLCTTFKRKEYYLVHVELLKFYLERGLILEKVHYAHLFKQDYVLRDYVQSNIEKRRHTKSEVMKTLYKLLNNSLYGKTCENVNKYRKFDVIEDESLFENPNRINSKLADAFNIVGCGENFLVELPVKNVKLNKPIQIGFTILEFAKREIYNFLAICQDHFGDDVIPLYTDTDSIMFWCNFNEPWKKFLDSPLKPLLDFEKVPEHWGVKTHDTDKQSGLWSPEANGKEIVEYCGLRAKCYCYRFRDDETVIKNKGVPKSSMIRTDDETPREKITMEHYKNALFNGALYTVSQYAIRSFKHDVITMEQYKLGLSGNDLKRAVTSNRAISLPFGYQGDKFADIVTDFDDPDHLDT